MNPKQQEFYFLFEFFDSDYNLFTTAIKELGKNKRRRSDIYNTISDIRFDDCDLFFRKNNYYKIEDSIDTIMSIPMNRLKNWKQSQKNILHDCVELDFF